MAEQEVWTTLKVLTWTKEFLLAKGVVNARLEAEWLLCAVTGLDRVGLYLQYDKPLIESELAEYRAKVVRRAKREPLQHILGSQEFCGLDYEVTADVLVPRHDTEILVSEAFMRHPDAASILDIGTGSGCIAVALQKLFTKAAVTATDISEAALTVARRNAERHGVDIEFLAGSLFVPVAGHRYDLVVSNPPYIPSADIESLDQEVRDYDPRSALDGGKDGLDIYRALIPSSVDFLNPGGWLLVEVGIGQAEEVVRLFRNSGGFREPVVTCDHGRIERTVGAQLKETP
jgi:release factor glutamine methyltransferase